MPTAILGEILSLLGAFLQPDFATTAAAQRLGLAQAVGPPGVTRLSPAGFSADFLTARREDLPGRPGFLTTLEFLWAGPPRLVVADLERLFGRGRLVCGTDNEEEDRFEIELRGHPLRGLLVVEFEGGTFGEELEAIRLRLVRIAPPVFAPADAAGETIVLLDDLGVTPDTEPRPLSVTLGPLFGPDDLMALIQPALTGTLPNRIAPGEAPLPFDFRPRNLGHFEPAVAPRLLTALAPLYDLRDALRDLEAGALKPREVRGRLNIESLPAGFRRSMTASLKDGTPTPTELLRDVEAVLTAQGAELPIQAGYRRLARAWHHLAALNAGLDAAAGQRIEVYPTTLAQLEDVLRQGPIAEELFHPEGAPLLVFVLGPGLADAIDGPTRRELTNLADRIETPLWYDPSTPFRPAAPAERPAAFLLPPLHKIIRRVETQFLAGDPPAAIEAAVTAALVARHAGTTPTVHLARSAGTPDRLTVTMELPVPAGITPLVFRYDANWHDYR